MSVKLRKKKLSSGKFSLYLDIYSNGKREYEFLKMYYDKKTPKSHKDELIKIADEVRLKRELELHSGNHDVTLMRKKNMDFLEYFEVVMKKKNNAINYWSVLKQIKTYAQGKKIKFRDVDNDFLEGFWHHLEVANIKVGTRYGYISKFSEVMKEAIDAKFITNNPVKKFIRKKKIKRPKSEYKFLTIEEVEKLIKTPCDSPEVKRGFLFGCFAGLRFSDIKDLTWRKIEDDQIIFFVKKTKERQFVPLSETAKSLIYSGLPDNTIPLPDKKIFNIPCNSNINIKLKIWAAKAGIDKHISFHVSRHTFATMALTRGVDIYTVSKLLGHASIETTQRYAEAINETRRIAVSQLPVYQF